MDPVKRELATFDSRSASEGPTRAYALFVRECLAELRANSTPGSEAFLDAADQLWLSDSPDAGALKEVRVRVWLYIDAKNRGSIRDIEDRVLRCLLGMLEPFVSRDEVWDTIDWSVQMGFCAPAQRRPQRRWRGLR